MLKPSVDAPIVFPLDLGNGTSEVAAIASSPFTLRLHAPNGDIKEVSSEINSDRRHVIAEIVPNGTKVEVLQ
jgi:hypothetical protein